MTDRKRLYDGLGKCAWAYFFLYFDLNLGSVSILPSFVAYMLFYRGIVGMEQDERELSLLRPLAVGLALWHGLLWLADWFPVLSGLLPSVLTRMADLANLYFHFQLLTNLADLAADHQPQGASLDRSIRSWRTVQTVMLTGIAIWSALADRFGGEALAIVMAMIYLIAGICLIGLLRKVRKLFKV